MADIKYETARAAKSGRKSKVISISEAGMMIAKHKSIALLDSSNAPMALIREAIRAGAKGLTLIPGMQVAHGCDLLVAAGCVELLYVCSATMELTPAFNLASKKGNIKYYEADEPFVILGARAAAYGLPFFPLKPNIWDAGALPQINPLIKRIQDPYTGEEVLTIPPLNADVCILHVAVADEYGNAQVTTRGSHEPDKVKSADIVILSAEEIVPNERIREEPSKTIIPGHLVDAVVHAPFGAHPQGVAQYYMTDMDMLRSYRELVQAGKAQEFLSKYVFEPKDHYEYLGRIGMERLFNLRFLA